MENASASNHFDAEMRIICVSKIQSHIRRFIHRKRLLKKLNEQYEKIYDPIRKRYYYYDTINDVSSWQKPALLRNDDIVKISPTYFPDEAAIIMQRALLRHVARRLVRLLYQDVVKVAIDPATRTPLYTNPKTGVTMSVLPRFMGGKLNHGYRDAAKIKKKYYNRANPKKPSADTTKAGVDPTSSKDLGESASIDHEDGNAEDEESDGSELSESSDAVVERRRLLRNYPRSKIQLLVDEAEDNRKTVHELNLSGVGAVKFTSRLYDLTKLTKLVMSHNKMRKISVYIKFLNQYGGNLFSSLFVV